MTVINNPAVVAELKPLVDRYEIALSANDLGMMSLLFYNGGETLRFDPSGEQHGHGEIDAWRANRTPPGDREVLRSEITTFDSHSAVATVEFRRSGQSGIGRQMQTWVNFSDLGWKVVAAHISFRPE